MGLLDVFGDHGDSYNEVKNAGHKAELSHELIAAAASYEAAKAYEHHVSKNGPPPTHEKAKELLAGFAGAFIDREVESKGLDFVDKERAKREARQHIDSRVDENNYTSGY